MGHSSQGSVDGAAFVPNLSIHRSICMYPLIDMLLDENPVEIVPHKLHLTGYVPTGYLYAPGQATPRTIMMTTGIVQVRR